MEIWLVGLLIILLKFWDLNNYTCIKTVTGHTGHVFSLNQLPDGKLVSGASD